MGVKPEEWTKQLAQYVFSFKEQEMNPIIVHQVKRVLIDYYCAAITGSQTEVGKLVLRYVLENEGEGPNHVIGSQKKLSPINAAFVNGTSSHCLDFDDGHTVGSIHPGAAVLPAVLSVSQTLNLNGEKMIAAIVVGYEICLRLASAMHPATRQRGFHNTPLVGIFGATAAVSYLYGLSLEQIQNAFGIAGSFCGGIFAFLGSGAEVKRIHPGQAASDGIKAVQLARNGLTGPTDIFEGENGIFQAYTGNVVKVNRLFKGLDENLEILNVYFKPYPCCRHLHTAIDVIQYMKKEFPIEIDQIAAVRVGVNKLAALHDHKECKNLLDAQMSLPYAVSAALVHDRLFIDVFEPKNSGQLMEKLIKKIEIYVDTEIDQSYPAKRAAKVGITMNDGKHYKHFSDNPLGEPSKPLSDKQLQLKFLDNCSPIVGKDKAQHFLAAINQIQKDVSFLYQI